MYQYYIIHPKQFAAYFFMAGWPLHGPASSSRAVVAHACSPLGRTICCQIYIAAYLEKSYMNLLYGSFCISRTLDDNTLKCDPPKHRLPPTNGSGSKSSGKSS